MSHDPPCAVCGRGVPSDEDHLVVDAEWVAVGGENHRTRYYLHQRCAETTVAGWQKP